MRLNGSLCEKRKKNEMNCGEIKGVRNEEGKKNLNLWM